MVLSEDRAVFESCTGEVVELNDEGVVDTQLTTLSELFAITCAVDTFVVWYDDGDVVIEVTTDVLSTDCASMNKEIKSNKFNIMYKGNIIIIYNY